VEDKLLDPEIERLTELYEKDPTSRVFAPLADAYRKSRLYDEAVDILKKGLEFHPDYVSAHLVLARCYREKNMLQLAKGSFERVLELDQQNVIALRLLGDILQSTDDMKGALSRYHDVLAIDPGNSEVQELVSRLEATMPAEQRSDVEPIEPSALTSLESSDSDAGSETPQKSEEETDVLSAPEVAPRFAEDDLEMKEEDPAEKNFILLTPDAAPSVDEEEVQGLKEGVKGFATVTLAEIYEGQGFLEKALDVYKQLLEKRPDDERIRERIESLSARLQPPSTPEIEQQKESLSSLLEDRAAKGAQIETHQPTEGPEKKDQTKTGNFSAFKQWLEGLSRNEESD
jgi:tetratricopeptide (TPR) repeat protein